MDTVEVWPTSSTVHVDTHSLFLLPLLLQYDAILHQVIAYQHEHAFENLLQTQLLYFKVFLGEKVLKDCQK